MVAEHMVTEVEALMLLPGAGGVHGRGAHGGGGRGADAAARRRWRP